MEKGNIKFFYEDGKTPSLEVELADNNLWLTSWEMARLLNCFVQRINANLRSIFKEKLLWESDVTYNHRYIYKGKEHQMMYYSMEVLIFMSYRINTFETKILRQFINSSLREHLQKGKSKKNTKLLYYFCKGQDYLLN